MKYYNYYNANQKSLWSLIMSNMNKWAETKHIICLTLIYNVVARRCFPFTIIVSLGWQAFLATSFFVMFSGTFPRSALTSAKHHLFHRR
jgi:hypothetical protein